LGVGSVAAAMPQADKADTRLMTTQTTIEVIRLTGSSELNLS
jgi:hypothetical protein